MEAGPSTFFSKSNILQRGAGEGGYQSPLWTRELNHSNKKQDSVLVFSPPTLLRSIHPYPISLALSCITFLLIIPYYILVISIFFYPSDFLPLPFSPSCQSLFSLPSFIHLPVPVYFFYYLFSPPSSSFFCLSYIL